MEAAGGKKGHEDAVRRVFRAVAEHHRLHRFPLAVRGAVDPEVKRAAGDGSVGSKAEQGLGAQHISEAITRIQKITEENVNVSVEMTSGACPVGSQYVAGFPMAYAYRFCVPGSPLTHGVLRRQFIM